MREFCICVPASRTPNHKQKEENAMLKRVSFGRTNKPDRIDSTDVFEKNSREESNELLLMSIIAKIGIGGEEILHKILFYIGDVLDNEKGGDDDIILYINRDKEVNMMEKEIFEQYRKSFNRSIIAFSIASLLNAASSIALIVSYIQNPHYTLFNPFISSLFIFGAIAMLLDKSLDDMYISISKLTKVGELKPEADVAKKMNDAFVIKNNFAMIGLLSPIAWIPIIAKYLK